MERWYDVVEASKRVKKTSDPKKTLFDLLDDAVRLRLIADVPVGAFLSGGVDSSIVSALAARHHKHLHTFSIGYADDPFFDESPYAEEVARHIRSDHHTFKLTREELAENYTRSVGRDRRALRRQLCPPILHALRTNAQAGDRGRKWRWCG